MDALCELLIDCVDGGASVSFMWPMTRAKAEDFWRDVAAGLQASGLTMGPGRSGDAAALKTDG